MKLENWSIEYINDLVKNANNRNVSKNLRNIFPYPYSVVDAEKFITHCQRCNNKHINLAIIEDNKAIGSVGVSIGEDIYEKSAEIGYWIGESYWGQGIMTHAIKEMIELCFSQYDIVRLYAVVFSHNKASCKVLEKCGFVFEGTLKNSIYKDGNIYDSRIYALVKK